MGVCVAARCPTGALVRLLVCGCRPRLTGSIRRAVGRSSCDDERSNGLWGRRRREGSRPGNWAQHRDPQRVWVSVAGDGLGRDPGERDVGRHRPGGQQHVPRHEKAPATRVDPRVRRPDDLGPTFALVGWPHGVRHRCVSPSEDATRGPCGTPWVGWLVATSPACFSIEFLIRGGVDVGVWVGRVDRCGRFGCG
jgi:hypothetical protein